MEKAYRLPSYKPCKYDGIDCDLSTPDEPCWGEVMITSDFFDEEQLHTCEGHSFCLSSPYWPSNLAEDLGKNAIIPSFQLDEE